MVSATQGNGRVAVPGCEYFGESKAHNAPPAPPLPRVQVIETSPQTVMVQSDAF